MVRGRLKIMKLDVCLLRPQLLELHKFFSEHAIDVAYITDNFLISAQKILVPAFSTYNHDRTKDRGSGVAT